MNTKISKQAEEAARLLFNACSIAQHTFDKATRQEALRRISEATDTTGLAPSVAAYSVAQFFMLNPVLQDGRLSVHP